MSWLHMVVPSSTKAFLPRATACDAVVRTPSETAMVDGPMRCWKLPHSVDSSVPCTQ